MDKKQINSLLILITTFYIKNFRSIKRYNSHCSLHSILLQSKGVNVILWSFNWISRIITLYRGNCCNLFRKISSIVCNCFNCTFFLRHYIILRIALDERTFWWKSRKPIIYSIYIQFQLLQIFRFGINFIVPQLFVHNCFSMSN